LDRKAAGKILGQLAKLLSDDKDDYLELECRGRAYMTGRLPDAATFRKGDFKTDVPHMRIACELIGWDEQADDFDGE
jgi:hypothetical protein